MQWYQPSLEEADPARPEMNPADRRVILLYALSRKGPISQSSIFPGFLWVSLHKINDLHDRWVDRGGQPGVALRCTLINLI